MASDAPENVRFVVDSERSASDVRQESESLLLPETRDDVRRRAEPLLASPRSAASHQSPDISISTGRPTRTADEDERDANRVVHEPPSPSGATDKYELLRVIGRGRHSVVHEAYDHALQRYVAIKQLDGELVADDRRAAHFWREAQFLAGLRHDNIVCVHGVDDAKAWIIMELMQGNATMLQQHGPVAPDLVRSILWQALEGLKHLHEKHKLHGEIKTSSLLINSEGRVKLSDSPGFSIDGEIRVPSESQQHVAPELLNPDVFGEVGPAVDIYCLGFAALELLLGREFGYDFKGVDKNASNVDLAWMRWHSSASEVLPPTKVLSPGTPDDLAFVIDRMVKKFADERYPSAEAAQRDLGKPPLVRA